VYYYALLNKISGTPSARILEDRIRIADGRKYALILKSYLRHQLNLIG
jgi:phytoene synthase